VITANTPVGFMRPGLHDVPTGRRTAITPRMVRGARARQRYVGVMYRRASPPRPRRSGGRRTVDGTQLTYNAAVGGRGLNKAVVTFETGTPFVVQSQTPITRSCCSRT